MILKWWDEQLRYKLPREPEHPLATVHPRAFRACVLCRRSMWIFVLGMFVGGVCSIVCSHVFEPHWLSGACYVSLLAMLCSGLGVVISLFVRLLIIALFFTRYSLAQLLGVVLCIGACGTGMAALPDMWKLVPAMGLFVLVMVVLLYVADQDPEGPVHTPAFLSRALAERRRNEQAKRGA